MATIVAAAARDIRGRGDRLAWSGVDIRLFTDPHQGATYDDVLRAARCAEDAGYDAFFRSDHYLRIAPGDGRPGPTDAWLTLAGLARDTRTIRLGTLVSAATFRHPGPLAIAVAQVDRMSGGRVEFGLGAGWFEAEHRAYGIPFPPLRERFDRLAEQLAIITGLWRTPPGETFSFAGEHYTLRGSPALPKPLQTPGPPVLVGGGGPKRTPALAARFADEFNLPFVDEATAAAQFARVDEACAAAGRDPLPKSTAQVLCVGRTEAELSRRAAVIGTPVAELRETGLAGSPAEVVDRLGRWRARTGISRCYVEVLDLFDLDHVELLAAEVFPQL